MPSSGNVFSDLGISEPDVEIAKADLAIRVQRLAEHRRLTPKQAAALLKVAESELPTLFQGRLASCSLDQLLRMLTWLGDDVEIIIRPRLQRTKRGAIRVVQVAAVERPDDFEPVHTQRLQRSAMSRPPDVSPDHNSTSTSGRRLPSDDRQLLDKHAIEKMTSLDITTIYRKMAAGTFPQPVKVGRRRVAWRASDVMAWQQDLEVGTETLRWRAARSLGDGPGPGAKRRRRK